MKQSIGLLAIAVLAFGIGILALSPTAERLAEHNASVAASNARAEQARAIIAQSQASEHIVNSMATVSVSAMLFQTILVGIVVALVIIGVVAITMYAFRKQITMMMITSTMPKYMIGALPEQYPEQYIENEYYQVIKHDSAGANIFRSET